MVAQDEVIHSVCIHPRKSNTVWSLHWACYAVVTSVLMQNLGEGKSYKEKKEIEKEEKKKKMFVKEEEGNE